MKLKLIYPDVPFWRAEMSRLALFIGGIEFEDLRPSREEIAKMRTEGIFPFGQFPVLQVDGKNIAQTGAIARFCGKLSGLYPTENDFYAAKINFNQSSYNYQKVISPFKTYLIFGIFGIILGIFYALILNVAQKKKQRKKINNYFFKIKKQLKWKHKIKINEGLIKTIDWYLENKKWYLSTIRKYKGERLGL